MASTYPSTTEVANRTMVAIVLADTLEALGYQADDVRGPEYPDYGRRAVAALARAEGRTKADGTKIHAGYTPSPATWATVVTILADREAKASPFAGFPS